MKKLELRNDTLEVLQQLLLSAQLKGTTSRFRTRFVKMIGEHLETLKEEHFQLIKDYAVLDENNEPVIEDDEYKIRDDEYEEFQQSYLELYSEYFNIEINSENRRLLKSVLTALDECENLSGEVAVIHEHVYDQIEKSLK